MIDKATRDRLESMKGMCLANKEHTFQYVSETKKGLVKMKCFGCTKFSNVVQFTVKPKEVQQ